MDCAFEDSGLYGGMYYPRVKVMPLSLAASAFRNLDIVSDVVTSMYVTVLTGVLSLWFRVTDGALRPGGDQAHMEFVSGQGPVEVILPPGQTQMVVGAGNSAACTATIVAMDREAHK